MINYAVFETEDLWLDFRAQYFTASEAFKLLTEPKSKSEVLSVGAKTYVREKAAAVLAPREPSYYNSAMEHGKNMEPVAALRFAQEIGRTLDDDDFIYTSNNGFVFFYDDEFDLGGTPDIIVKKLNISGEIKCPNSDTHLEYLTYTTAEEIKKYVPKYYGQTQTNMYLSKTEICKFMSFDDRFYNEEHHSRFIDIPRDEEYIKRLLDKAHHAKEYKKSILETLKVCAVV